VAKLEAHQLATAVLWVRIQTFLKQYKMSVISKEVANTVLPAIKYTIFLGSIGNHSSFCSEVVAVREPGTASLLSRYRYRYIAWVGYISLFEPGHLEKRLLIDCCCRAVRHGNLHVIIV
jgi:hypothetical protein